MKTKYWVATTLALLVAATANATEIPKMNIVNSGNEKAIVMFNSPTALPIEVSICSETGEMVYYWKSEKPENRLSQDFDLSEIGTGKFNVCINYGGQSINRELVVQKNGIKVGPLVQLYEPYFQFEDDQLKVSFLNAVQKNVYLNIYKEGEHITGVKLGKNMDIQKCIDFSKLENGKYRVILSDNFKDHNYIVQK